MHYNWSMLTTLTYGTYIGKKAWMTSSGTVLFIDFVRGISDESLKQVFQMLLNINIDNETINRLRNPISNTTQIQIGES